MQKGKDILEAESNSHQPTKPAAGALILDFPASRTVRK
jgi:hypothetical protein